MKKITLLLIAIMAFSFPANSQTKKLTIQVTDKNNKPVSGAVILFDNVRQKSWTNSKGIFKIKVNKNPEKISAFSPKIGIKTVKYNGQKKVKIIILKGNKNLLTIDENKKNIDPKQFWSIYDYLRGNIPGVNVSSGNVITIRGYGTINGNSTPLFILNGTNINQKTFGRIRPNLIKSITILKGPETAVYGSRGANGVIVIKTL
ncbi:hypothetical protein CSC81_12060 [Tenacibaculum discolor]|uniref:TonB-dependent receptor plug domain-containing protein n=1 Tax=Tenacibaculum discolor TaxID=361581 RepID=A0A2G1BSX9_9FLAO|nr:TonB-dependent receptor plug domain-containing protein [Tenacibaculum discolor]MDP2542483.1 TonB-dependent receptor plug domain-containing protein [Tenacibaculum discolor]PHN97137.1 hypothetical protein CSC81_12060 [Tenacibaculum discolor]PHO00349.1 hypothetical protein CSC82_29270 [Rhodobacteraceae bacterium 4F10]